MTRPIDLLVFSDLDGTLLSHDTYSWAAARPALEALHAQGCGLILATSKTAAEVAPLRAEIGFPDWPAIVENGAGLLPAGATPDTEGPRYQALRAALAQLPSGFRGFGDMSTGEVAQITGLAPDAAAMARCRAFTEPGLWEGSDDGLTAFLAAAAAQGITARRGGRFLTLSFGGTKADRMDEIIAAHGPRHTIALGDAPNDVEMLQRAGFGVIVKNSASAPLAPVPGEDTGRITRTEAEGPAGWAEAVLHRLKNLPPASGKDPEQARA